MKTKNKSASALIFATILLFVVLSLVVSMSYVTVLEQKMSQKTKSSVSAFYSADSGIEWALNKIAHPAGLNIDNNFTMLTGGKIQTSLGGIDVYLLDKNGNVITSNDTLDSVKAVRAVGSESTGGTTRAIEAAVAATSGGCYVSYGTPPSPAPSPNDMCMSGYSNKGDLGQWGHCKQNANFGEWFMPPAGHCGSGYSYNGTGEAYLCCPN